MKYNELEVIHQINTITNASLKPTTKNTCTYDAENSKCIVEIKCRSNYYNEKLIETIKLFKNLQTAQIQNKLFLYVVKDKKGIWICNISSNINAILQTTIQEKKCPITTEFSNNKYITKYCYFIPEILGEYI